MHIIAMSATIGNLDEIGTFLNAQVYTHDFRPVELEEYIKCGNTVYKINRNAQKNCYLTVDRELDYKVRIFSNHRYSTCAYKLLKIYLNFSTRKSY